LAIVLGYHGCDEETAQKLLSGSPFVESRNLYDWLGQGIYFWEWDIVRAYEWASKRRPDRPSVVGAVIDLGNCLDLTTRAGTLAVRRAHSSFVELQNERGRPIPTNLRLRDGDSNDLILRFLDKSVIDHLHKGYKEASEATQNRIREFDTVRALFPEGKALYEDAGFLEKTHVQIAVRARADSWGLSYSRV
jgi:hypothetical protein